MAENGAIIAIYGQSETFFVEIRPVAAVRGRSNPGALGLARDSFIDSPSVTGFGKVALMSGFFPGYRDPAVIEEMLGGGGQSSDRSSPSGAAKAGAPPKRNPGRTGWRCCQANGKLSLPSRILPQSQVGADRALAEHGETGRRCQARNQGVAGQVGSQFPPNDG